MTNREIDALVAEKVMGLDPKILLGGNFLDYSTDIKAAWKVVETEFHRIVICNRDTDEVTCILQNRTDNYSVKASTAPLAICKAALKAKGIEC